MSELPRVIGTPANLKRSMTIAIVIGTLFVAMNQLEIIASGQANAIVWFKAALTYLTPFLVSNMGILSATHRRRGWRHVTVTESSSGTRHDIGARQHPTSPPQRRSDR